ncbi:MAG TPA: Holliday junction branch migration protein RuvA [Candidatus Corynebacterium avicola]|uniref:Holliday junction branch migration complex subunit RuvA n=1 Tax=Candidatus Corynebacterium avicola TaxID=2838527 RepID=A0A9D1RQM0_9CORY|nr:Holliday junction branch migration protein RuvA [Candidatus Corynebacterium avicola]
MIASLRGTLIDKGLDYAVIECGGVGYLCQATARTLGELPRGEEVFVLTTLVVREDSQTLYAFPDAASREMFGVIQKVSGVGARLALGVMSVLEPHEFARAVADGDAKTLQRAPGVGKRLAERMALELKGKLDGFLPPAGAGSGQDAVLSADGAAGVEGSAVSEATAAQVVEALVGLGFTEKVAASAVAAAASETEGEPDASVLLRACLARLGGQ